MRKNKLKKMKKVFTLPLSFKCNNKCISCVNEEISFELSLFEIKEFIIKAPEKNYSTLVITGGEPTINNDLIKIIEMSKENNFARVVLQTNARKLIQKKLLKTLNSAGVDMFSVTIYGHSSLIHDSITQVKGSFRETIRGIENIIEEGYFIRTNIIITKLNARYLFEIAKLLIALSVNEVKFTFPHGIGRAAKYFEIVIPRFKYIKPFLYEAINELKCSSVRPWIEAVPPCLLIGFERYYADYFAEKVEGYIPFIKNNNFYPRKKIFEKAYTRKCLICDYRGACSGIYVEYLLKFGDDEIKPVKIER